MSMLSPAVERQLRALMVAIRQTESGGRYDARSASSSASGAYQYLDSTWAGYGGYSRAADAPPEVQDRRMWEDLVRRWETYGDLTAVAMAHYLPAAVTDPRLAHTVPQANRVTPAQYAATILQRAGLSSSSSSSATDVQAALPAAPLAVGGAAALGWLGSRLFGDAIDDAKSAVLEGAMLIGLWITFVGAGLAIVILGLSRLTGVDPRRALLAFQPPGG